MARTHRGQATVELAILIGVAVLAFVAMAVYAHRGYQGYLYTAASAHGQQFDPEQPYLVTQQFALQQQQDVEVVTGQAAVTLAGGVDGLPRTPGGQIPGRILGTKVRSEAQWTVDRGATYEAQ